MRTRGGLPTPEVEVGATHVDEAPQRAVEVEVEVEVVREVEVGRDRRVDVVRLPVAVDAIVVAAVGRRLVGLLATVVGLGLVTHRHAQRRRRREGQPERLLLIL